MKKQTSAVEQALARKLGTTQQGGAAQSQPQRQDPYGGAQQPMEEAPEELDAQTPMFEDIRDELVELIRSGRLPENFDLQRACTDPAFAELVAQFPLEAAIRVYAAEKQASEADSNAMQRVTTQVRSRNALPKSTRGGAMSAPAANYRDMDSATFRKMLGEMKKTTRNGGRVRL